MSTLEKNIFGIQPKEFFNSMRKNIYHFYTPKINPTNKTSNTVKLNIKYLLERKRLFHLIQQISSKLHFKFKTYYLSLLYLDIIFNENPRLSYKCQKNFDILAIVCLMIAAKFCENDLDNPLPSEYITTYSKINSKNVFCIKDIIYVEVLICKILKYKLNYFTVFDFISFFFANVILKINQIKNIYNIVIGEGEIMKNILNSNYVKKLYEKIYKRARYYLNIFIYNIVSIKYDSLILAIFITKKSIVDVLLNEINISNKTKKKKINIKEEYVEIEKNFKNIFYSFYGIKFDFNEQYKNLIKNQRCFVQKNNSNSAKIVSKTIEKYKGNRSLFEVSRSNKNINSLRKKNSNLQNCRNYSNVKSCNNIKKFHSSNNINKNKNFHNTKNLLLSFATLDANSYYNYNRFSNDNTNKRIKNSKYLSSNINYRTISHKNLFLNNYPDNNKISSIYNTNLNNKSESIYKTRNNNRYIRYSTNNSSSYKTNKNKNYNILQYENGNGSIDLLLSSRFNSINSNLNSINNNDNSIDNHKTFHRNMGKKIPKSKTIFNYMNNDNFNTISDIKTNNLNFYNGLYEAKKTTFENSRNGNKLNSFIYNMTKTIKNQRKSNNTLTESFKEKLTKMSNLSDKNQSNLMNCKIKNIKYVKKFNENMLLKNCCADNKSNEQRAKRVSIQNNWKTYQFGNFITES